MQLSSLLDDKMEDDDDVEGYFFFTLSLTNARNI